MGTQELLIVGRRFRSLREHVGLTMRQVTDATETIAEDCGNPEFIIPTSWLSDLETKGAAPSIYRICALATVYGHDQADLFRWYGVDLNLITGDGNFSTPARTHLVSSYAATTSLRIPVRMEFDARFTANVSRSVKAWEVVPLSSVQHFERHDYSYGYIGREDMTMYPILLPGTFVQIDRTISQIAERGWRSEYERPIYFADTRLGYTCCWCALNREVIILQSHPLSQVAPRVLRYPQEVEIVGQVVGIVMNFGARILTDVGPAKNKSDHFSRKNANEFDL